MTRITIQQAYDPVEVDLWGETFTTVDAPRSVAKKAAKIGAALDGAQDDDEAVKMLGQLLDLKLHGNGTKPSTLVNKKWKADELTVRQLLGFLDRLSEAERPTLEEPLESSS